MPAPCIEIDRIDFLKCLQHFSDFMPADSDLPIVLRFVEPHLVLRLGELTETLGVSGDWPDRAISVQAKSLLLLAQFHLSGDWVKLRLEPPFIGLVDGPRIPLKFLKAGS